MKKNIFIFYGFMFMLFQLTFVTSMAQAIKVNGKVLSAAGNPIPGVTIANKGTGVTVQSNADGLFTIEVNNQSILTFTAIGFKILEIPAQAGSMNVVLESQSELLDQVVVVGYSKQKKVNLTGAVSVISGNELAKRPVFNTTVALQGALPGVTVSQFNGVPGQAAQIRIRGIGTLGNNDPLILIDGVVSGIGDVDP
ncbi:MAG: hypothetical protein RLZZ45_1659, partial [Bacteroidota bacterium]